MEIKEALMTSKTYTSCMQKLSLKDRKIFFLNLVDFIFEAEEIPTTNTSFSKTYPWYRQAIFLTDEYNSSSR